MYLKLLICLLFAFPANSFADSSFCAQLFDGSKTRFALTQEKKIKYLKLAISLPLTVAASNYIWKSVDENYFWPKAEANISAQILTRTEADAKFFDSLIKNDFRFRRIKSIDLDLKAAQLDPRLKSLQTQKRMMAFQLAKNFESYYQKYRSIKNPSGLTLKENEELFGESPLFRHLDFFFENGVKNYEGSLVDEKYVGPLTENQKNSLYNLTHNLYSHYALVDLAFSKNNRQVLNQSEEVKDMLNDSYVKRLIHLREQGKISNEELVYYLQEDAYNRYYLKMFEVMHIVNLKSEDGQYTTESITLADLRNSRLELIKN